MKRLFKIVLYFFIGLASFLVLLIVFLNIYYSVLEHQYINEKKAREQQGTKPVLNVISHEFKTADKNLNLIPVPKKVTYAEGSYKLPAIIAFSADDSLKDVAVRFLASSFPGIKTVPSVIGSIRFKRNTALPPQGYFLKVTPSGIVSEFSSHEGLWYSLVTLKVLNRNYKGWIPCVSIEDSPDLETRGLMLDISRDKVPTRETLLKIAGLISDLKYNHLELYIEGFSFAYPSFKDLWEGKETPVSGEDIKVLDSFCREHFIDLVPNQNSLGHMMQWLATPQYSDLAEVTKGYKGTLDPSDSRSLGLVTRMTDDLLPEFTSSYFNVGLDEPFELGQGKSKELVKKEGIGKVYLDYVLKMHNLALSRKKKMLMWGDIVFKHPELIPQVPKDITLLDWGYEASYPFERHAKVLHDEGLNFMVCPGTSSWTSITGRTDNMLSNIESAARAGAKYGARGLLLTDWGDGGHWQYLPVSYAGYAAASSFSWNSRDTENIPLPEFLDSYIFGDEKKIMGKLVLEMGSYNSFEEFYMLNMTTTILGLALGLRDRVMTDAVFKRNYSAISGMTGDISPEMIADFRNSFQQRKEYDFKGLNKFLDSREALIKQTSMNQPDSKLVKEEYLNAIRLIRAGSELKNYIELGSGRSVDEQKSQLEKLSKLCAEYLDENKRLWLMRDKPGGLERSTASITGLKNKIDGRLKTLDSLFLSRLFNRLVERTVTSGIVLYLKIM